MSTPPGCRVSIHTPTKGVTRVGQSKRANETGFNPHTHEGCDVRNSRPDAGQTVSIHTPTKGVTELMEESEQTPDVSIHTPTKGVT